MDGLRLPPVIEEASDDLGDLKEEKPSVLAESLMAKEREPGEEEEKAEGEKGQHEEKEIKEEKGEEEGSDEDQDVEQLRSQMAQLLSELEETREDCQRHQEGFLELQGVLEDERLASAHQAESFGRHIQRLQAQIRAMQEEMDGLEAEKDAELEEVQEDLRQAQEEVLLLQQGAEEAAAERENDIASLQEELCRLRVELQRLRATAQEYELEKTSLRAEICMKKEAPGDGRTGLLEEELLSLNDERQSLVESNNMLSRKVEHLELQRDECDNIYLAVREEVDADHGSYITVSPSGPHPPVGPPTHEDPKPPPGLKNIKIQLQRAEAVASDVQKECEGLKGELEHLQQLYDSSQRERAALEEELRRCRAELRSLLGAAPQGDSGGWNVAVVAVAMAAVVVLVIPSFTRA